MELKEGEEGLVSGCSRTESDMNDDPVMVATEPLVVSCHSCSLTPSVEHLVGAPEERAGET
jgi:hypothetical protein